MTGPEGNSEFCFPTLITSSEFNYLRLIFRNIGVNINWWRPLFCILSKIAPKILKLGVN